jgi:hypothetical protein
MDYRWNKSYENHKTHIYRHELYIPTLELPQNKMIFNMNFKHVMKTNMNLVFLENQSFHIPYNVLSDKEKMI